MKTAQLRKEFTKALIAISKQLDPKEKNKIAAALDVSLRCVERYLGGQIANIELAEAIIVEAETIIKTKN